MLIAEGGLFLFYFPQSRLHSCISSNPRVPIGPKTEPHNESLQTKPSFIFYFWQNNLVKTEHNPASCEKNKNYHVWISVPYPVGLST
jgi:hypothetical protein